MRPVTDLTKRVSDIGQQAAAAHAYTTYGADHGVGGNGRAQGPYPYTSPPEYQHYTPNSAYQRRRPEDDGAYAGIAGQTLRSPLNYGAGPQGFGYKAIHAEGLDEGDRRGSDWSRSTSATRVNEDEYDYAGHGSNQSKRVAYGSAGGGEVYNDRRDDAVDRDRGDEQDDDEESDHGSDHAHDHDDRSPKAPKLGHGLSPSTAVKRDFAGRRKIKGTKGIDLSLEAGKLVFDKCTRMDAKYRQPRMVILESIKETETYKAIQDRSANSLAKAGTSDRYKDRTQSLLDLLEDNGIIWGKVLKAGNHPGGGPCGSCEHYDRECIVPLKKVMPEYPGDTGYRILSICIHCKLYHTCDLNSSVEYKPTSKAIKIVNTTRIKSRGNRPEEDAIKEEPASPARPAKRSAASSSTPKDRPKAALPSRSSKPPARTASAPATAPTRVSTRIQARRDTIRFDADLEPSDADEEDEEGQEEVVEASEQEEAETKKGGKSGGKATQKGSRGSSAAPTRQDGMHDRLESIREFIAEMKEREKGRTKGRVDYATRVMFDKAEEDVEVLAALPKTSVYGGSRIEF